MDLAKLLVRLELQSAQMLKELERANSSITKFANSTQSKLQKWAAQIGTFFTARAIFNFSKDVVKAEADLVSMAERAGTSVEEFSRLGYAASQSGSSIEGMDAALKGLANTAAEAQKGSKSAQAAFDAIGISAEGADGALKDTSQLLVEIADKFSQYQDGAAKSALAQELFGKSGRELIPLLNKGAEGIAELKARADELGITVSTQTAVAANELTDQLATLGAVTRGVVGKALAEVVPLLSALTKEAIDAQAAGEGLGRFSEQVAAGFKLVVDIGYSVYKTFDDIGTALGALGAAAVQFAQGNFAEARNIMQQANEDQIQSEKRANEFLEKLWSDTGKTIVKTVQKTDDEMKKTLVFGDQVESDAIKNAVKALTQFRDSLREQVVELDQTGAAATRYRLEVGNLADEVKRAGAAGQQLKLEIIAAADAKQAKEDLKEITAGLMDVNAQILELQGKQAEGAVLKFDKENLELVKTLRREGNEAGLAQIATLRGLIEAQAQFNELEKEAKVIKDDLAAQEERLGNSREAGAITELQLLQDLDAARTHAAEQLAGIAEKQKEIAENSGSDTMAQQAKNAAREVENLRAQTDLLEKKIRSTFEDAFADAFEGLVSGAKSAEEAIGDFLQNIAAMLLQIAAQNIAQSFFKTDTGSSIVSGIAGLFSGGASGGGRAMEGAVNPGVAYNVGENGPERFVPNVAGRIEDQRRWGGSRNNIYVTVEAPKGTVSRQTQLQTGSTIAKQIGHANRRNN